MLVILYRLESRSKSFRRCSPKERERGMKMKDRKLLGKIGEDMAEIMLFSQGYSILARNFMSHNGEIDIVAEKYGTVYFVEVKTRTTEKFGEPEEAVDEVKKQRIRSAADYFLMLHHGEFTGIDPETGLQSEGDPEVVFKVIEIMVRETDDDFLMEQMS